MIWSCDRLYKLDVVLREGSGCFLLKALLRQILATLSNIEDYSLHLQKEKIFFLTYNCHAFLYTGILYFRKCRWRQKSCQRSFAAKTWAEKGWFAPGWNHYSLDSPERNPPYQTCHLANFGTQWPSFSHFSSVYSALRCYFSSIIWTLLIGHYFVGGPIGFSTWS